MTVNQTIRQTRKVIAYFRHSMVQKWGQGQLTNKLVFLTVVLGAFTFIQTILMAADIFKHK